jgi:hypothetical protein
MSRVIPERSAKAGAAGRGGGPDQYTGTWGLACDREILERVAAAAFFGTPRARIASRWCSVLGGGAQTPLSWSDRLLESIRDYCVARSRANSRSIGDG